MRVFWHRVWSNWKRVQLCQEITLSQFHNFSALQGLCGQKWMLIFCYNRKYNLCSFVWYVTCIYIPSKSAWISGLNLSRSCDILIFARDWLWRRNDDSWKDNNIDLTVEYTSCIFESQIIELKTDMFKSCKVVRI